MELHILLNFKTEIGGCFQAATDRKMFASCTPTDLWGMDEGIIPNDYWYHAGKAPMALKRRESRDFSGIPKHMGER